VYEKWIGRGRAAPLETPREVDKRERPGVKDVLIYGVKDVVIQNTAAALYVRTISPIRHNL
jgi:hypothetical protein